LGKIDRFEDIKAWVMAKDLVVTVYQITGKGKFVHDFGLRDQIRRAAISAMSNIAEEFERGYKAEF
jgi:four helix bundle protein